MKRSGMVALLVAALSLTACGGDDGTAAPATTSLLSGRYTARTSVASIATLRVEIGEVSEHAEMKHFADAETMLRAGMPVATWLSGLDAAYANDAMGTGASTLQGMTRAALARWRAAPMDDAIATGVSEVLEKALVVGHLLSMHTEVRATLTAIDANDWTSARAHWDAAAAWYVGLDTTFGRRSDTTVPNVWGAGMNNVTDENLATRTTELLTRGAALLDARGAVNARDVARQLLVYSTKHAFLSAINYANVFETRAAMMGDLEYPRAEGGMLFEGVIMPFPARAAQGTPVATAASTARARWAFGVTAAQGPTRLSTVRDSAALYALLTADGVTNYVTASDADRAATRSTLRGTVDTLDEALAFASQNPADLRMKLIAAEARSTANDHAGAAVLLRDVQNAIDAVARVGQQ